MKIAMNHEGLLIYAASNLDSTQKYFCPKCKKPVHLRKGRRVRPYFAHKACLVVSTNRSNEKEEHKLLKKVLGKWFAKSSANKIEFEKYLPQIDQRPDLLINNSLAIEIQCSFLSLKQLQKRCLAYHKLGLKVIWLCGKKLHLTKKLIDLNRALLNHNENIGFYYWEADLKRQELRLFYHIEETLTHQIYYDKLQLPFFQKNLCKFLALPKFLPRVKKRKFPAKKIAQQYLQELSRRLYFKDRKTMALQAQFYQEGRTLLALPQYYYYPATRNLACAESMLSWKRKFYQHLQKKLSLQHFTVQNQHLKLNLTPLVPEKVHLNLFIAYELFSLKKMGFLEKL